MRRIVFALIGLGLVAIVAIGLIQSGHPNHKPRSAAVPAAQAHEQLAGSPAALAALHRQANQLLGGGPGAVQARLRALRGHPVVLNGWASWCGPCRSEFPYLQRASVRFGRQVAFLGLDTGDNHGDAKSFLARFPVSYPSYEDPGTEAVTALKAPKGLPFMLFYDARGRVSYIHQGAYPSLQRLEDDIRRYAIGHAVA